jgi:argininosuccinate lyase
MKKKMKPWGGRFQEPTDEFVEQFTASVGYDKRLAAYDIMGSIAHAQTLAHVGVLNKKESESIVEGLKTIKADIDRGKFDWRIDLEDVHMNIESALVERIGEVGKKLHTGRSRNDQVATDLRLFLREAIDTLQGELHAFQTVLVDRAEQEAATLMPGLTHLQIAQPVTLGHHFLAWFEMLQRDGMRLQECRARVNLMPLGAAALAGTSFPIDRRYTAELLGFDGLCQNSLDAVSDRDFVTEFISASTLLMIHLSRMAEELILWSSDLVGFVGLSDRYCTGSSIMPPKKNPDVPELVRGKFNIVADDD